MEYGELMTSVMLEIFPNGFPTDEQVKEMSEEEKHALYLRQKELIHTFRERADNEILILQERIKELPPIHVDTTPLTKAPIETRSTEVLPRQPIREPIPKPSKTPRNRKQVKFVPSQLPTIEFKRRIRPPVQQLPTPPKKVKLATYNKPPFYR